MSETVENYDGLCGIIARFASTDMQLRCHYEIGHSGPCSFEKYHDNFRVQGGCFVGDFEKQQLEKKDDDGVTEGFKQSVLRDLQNYRKKTGEYKP